MSQEAVQARSGSKLNANAPEFKSEQPEESVSESEAGVPLRDQEAVPLSWSEMHSLSEGEIVYILEPDTKHWTRYLFVCVNEKEGFTVKRKVSKDGDFENTLIRCNFDEDMPVMYRHSDAQGINDSGIGNAAQSEAKSVVQMMSDLDYKAGSKLLVYLDGNTLTQFTVLSFDESTTKATLQDESGMQSTLFLKQFRHESAASVGSKGLDIVDATVKHKSDVQEQIQ